MLHKFKINAISEILASIYKTLDSADRYAANAEDISWLIQHAFVKTRMFLEAAGLPEMLKSLQQLEELAQKNYTQAEYAEELGEVYSVWGSRLRQYVYSIEEIFGEPRTGNITKDLIEILRATQYSITDKKCFHCPPVNESEVHVRIEAVLRCVFPDLIHKPKITKQIKHFEPDTGLPSLRTLIEYKFISNQDEAKRIADEVLSDTRGYVSKVWDRFVYVIYETTRVRPETHWSQLLEESGASENTTMVVISGEEPSNPRFLKQGKRESRKSAIKQTRPNI